ncbi:MAG: exodeoxyribonuclease III [Ignavibacteria bacterium GWB2_35_12]|nr:MAG: exodeoxyribonuclease III [Ignavibacteria bacterium GWA2_35_8]OGU38693.1 MAG: exodeoxyribonuclease III [Ignavibacteria bacterium GWB2_35_12]OGU88824.1 MAG: exodeoxyribonuclease III [Ignavibacteria bacterium RIFOXYA2_FULL_35_10]OGV20889.1 MAG: exodeoxyribonuclease III [Ignavibacteria bacterium RIFOXYC2_FULL_35_21]
MRIISWNINGYRAITGQNPSKRYDKVTKENKLFRFIESEKPDIICLQETKASPGQIDDELLCPDGYDYFYSSSIEKKGYSGVAVFYKIKPEKIINNLNEKRFDVEGRVIEMHFKDFILFNVYFPKGYEDSERLNYKLEFYDVFFNYVEELNRKNKKIIITGDYNTAHHEIDLARPKENITVSGFMPIEREKLDWIETLGYVDTFRLFNKGAGHYTWWSQRGRARENNIGWRIDYFFVTKNVLPLVKDSYHKPDVLGSDHCPIILELV